MENYIDFIKDFKIMEVKDGDILVFKIRETIPSDKVDKIKEMIISNLSKSIRNKIDVMILVPPFEDVGILRPINKE